MYAEYLQGLADLATTLNSAAQMGGTSDKGVSTPYIAGKVEVRLDGEIVGHFRIEDEWVIFDPIGKEDK